MNNKSVETLTDVLWNIKH